MIESDLWPILGLAPTGNRDLIRRAYVARLKVTNPEDDPNGFRILREAYESALALADTRQGGSPVLADHDNSGVPVERDVARYAATSADASALDEPVDDGEIRRLIVALAHRVHAEDQPGFSIEMRQVFSAIEVLLPRMTLDRVRAVEEAVAEIVACHLPHSAPLAAPTVRAFGWTSDWKPGVTGQHVRAIVDFHSSRYMEVPRIEEIPRAPRMTWKKWTIVAAVLLTLPVGLIVSDEVAPGEPFAEALSFVVELGIVFAIEGIFLALLNLTFRVTRFSEPPRIFRRALPGFLVAVLWTTVSIGALVHRPVGKDSIFRARAPVPRFVNPGEPPA